MYKLIGDKSELTFEEKLDLVQSINNWDGSFDNLEFFENCEDFFDEYFNSPGEAVRATYFGDYRYADEYVRFNGYANLDSFTDYEAEAEIDYSLDEIIERFAELLNDGNVDDWNGLFELCDEVEEEE